MFDVYCPEHGSRILLFAGDIEEIRNTEEGIEVHYRCPCGYRGVWLTGQARGKSMMTKERGPDTLSGDVA